MEDITIQGTTYSNTFKLETMITISVVIVIPIEISIPVTVWMAPDVGPVKAIADIPSIPLFPDLPSGLITIEVTGNKFLVGRPVKPL